MSNIYNQQEPQYSSIELCNQSKGLPEYSSSLSPDLEAGTSSSTAERLDDLDYAIYEKVDQIIDRLIQQRKKELKSNRRIVFTELERAKFINTGIAIVIIIGVSFAIWAMVSIMIWYQRSIQDLS